MKRWLNGNTRRIWIGKLPIRRASAASQSFSWGDWYNFGNSHRLMAGRILSITEKIPKLQDIAPVYAVIVMMIYPWTLTR